MHEKQLFEKNVCNTLFWYVYNYVLFAVVM